MTTSEKDQGKDKAPFALGPMDISIFAGILLMSAGTALVNIPLALFLAGALIYFPALIVELR